MTKILDLDCEPQCKHVAIQCTERTEWRHTLNGDSVSPFRAYTVNKRKVTPQEFKNSAYKEQAQRRAAMDRRMKCIIPNES